jgi:hypothetical protein
VSASLIATQWTTPTTPAVRPWILWCDWIDLIAYLDVLSVKITDPGGNAPAVMSATLVDKTNTVGGLIAQNQRILYVETQANANAGRILFHGFIKFIRPVLTATYARWELTCTDLSEFLDCSYPIDSMDRPVESDRARIGAILGSFSTWSGMLGGGFVQQLNPALGVSSLSHMSVRNGIEDTLKQSGSVPAGYYVDFLGYLHTYASGDAGAAPYSITDTPNYTTSIPAKLEPEYDGSGDVDGIAVQGGSGAGSLTALTTAAPRFPFRVAPLDSPGSMDAATAAFVGATELANRQQLVRLKVTVNGDQQHGGFDGWAKGQVLSVTNAALGWVNRIFIIQGVDMSFRNGVGLRQYVLTCGSRPLMKRRLGHRLGHMRGQIINNRQPGNSIGGRVGSPTRPR